MAFRFRKSFKIAPGIRINIGKSGLSSIGIGPRGASMSIGKQGVYSNVGISGTGLSFRSKLGSNEDKRRIEREDRRLQKAQKKMEELEHRINALSKVTLSLTDNGSISAINAHAEPLSRKDIKLMWEQKSETITQWLQDEADEINGDVELLESIYYDTPNPESEIDYQVKEYNEPRLEMPQGTDKPQKEELPSLGFFAGFFKSTKQAHEKMVKEIEERNRKNLETWEKKQSKAMEQYKIVLSQWEEEKIKFDEKEKYNKENFFTLINENIDFMEESLADVLDTLSWPRETIISYEVDDGGKMVWVDIDLPEIEDFPQKVATIAASGKKLNIKNKAKKQLQLEYAKHIHGIAFRGVGTIFAVLPKAENIIISGYSQRLDKATGKINDDYLYSFKVDRKGFSQIDFEAIEQVDPIAAMDAFEKRKKMTATGIFKPIEPFSK